jgi:hypothetical protein
MFKEVKEENIRLVKNAFAKESGRNELVGN